MQTKKIVIFFRNVGKLIYVTEMSEEGPLELFAPEDSLAGKEALPTLFESIADEKKTQEDAGPEPESAAILDDGLSDDDEEPRRLTRAQKKLGKARISRADSKTDETYSPRVSSLKGNKKRVIGKKGSKNLPKVKKASYSICRSDLFRNLRFHFC